MHTAQPDFLHGCRGSELKSSCSHNQHFTHATLISYTADHSDDWEGEVWVRCRAVEGKQVRNSKTGSGLPWNTDCFPVLASYEVFCSCPDDKCMLGVGRSLRLMAWREHSDKAKGRGHLGGPCRPRQFGVVFYLFCLVTQCPTIRCSSHLSVLFSFLCLTSLPHFSLRDLHP